MSRQLLWLMITLCTAGPSFAGGIFKCESPDGHATYQGTTCDSSSRSLPIDVRYSNVGSIGLDADSEALITRISQDRSERRASRIRERNARLEQTLQDQARQEAKCAALQEQLEQMYVERRYHRVDADRENDLIRRTRNACAQ